MSGETSGNLAAVVHMVPGRPGRACRHLPALVARAGQDSAGSRCGGGAVDTRPWRFWPSVFLFFFYFFFFFLSARGLEGAVRKPPGGGAAIIPTGA